MSDLYNYDDIPWPEFTEDDFIKIDKICQEANTQTNEGAARISIECGETTDVSKKIVEDKSPYEAFRRGRGYLSVSDLVGPAWCEVQFDYGLHQKRYLPLKLRPKKFKTQKGKVIHVETNVAARVDIIKKNGEVVHKALEKQVHKEEVIINVQSKEERWALRLVDVLVRLKTLKEMHICRELPVWGILQDQAICGVIDEIRLVPNDLAGGQSNDFECSRSRLPPRKKAKNNSALPSQPSLSNFFHAESDTICTPHAPTGGSFMLQIFDAKTRSNATVPKHVDTFPARLQLMLYWRLLDQIIKLEMETFFEFCSHLHLDLDEPFADDFKKEISEIALDNQFSLHFLDANCLKDVVLPYRETINELGVNYTISESLLLVYRMRKGTKKGAGSKIDTEEQGTGSREPSSLPSKELLEPVEGIDDYSSLNTSTSFPVSKHGESLTQTTLLPQKRARCDSQETEGSATAEDESMEKSNDSVHVISPGQIIGTKRFLYKQKVLDNYLTSVLEWWHGKRLPIGVQPEQINRCSTCEYKNGCEWREQKHIEALKALHVALPARDNGSTSPS